MNVAACSDLSTIVARRQFCAHEVNFQLYSQVLVFLTGEVVACQAQLGVDALGRQQVGVLQLVLGAQEIAGLDVALVEQRLEQVVDLARLAPRRSASCRWLSCGCSSTILRMRRWTCSAGDISCVQLMNDDDTRAWRDRQAAVARFRAIRSGLGA